MLSYNSTEFAVPPQGTYLIQKSIVAYASNVFFIYGEQTTQRYCLKMWRPRNNLIYQTMKQSQRCDYLVEGFYINRQWAPGVYLGIASIDLDHTMNSHSLHLGHLITSPQRSDLKQNAEYALVMKCLDDSHHVLNLLQSKLVDRQIIDFLAQEIAKIHQSTSTTPQELAESARIGSIGALAAKLALNQKFFSQAVLTINASNENKEILHSIIEMMNRAYHHYLPSFTRRLENKHIKRCHGDLKASNLWICPKEEVECTRQKQVLALDCIDFKPEFCHIDTLSDIAMLAVDIDFYLTNTVRGNNDTQDRRWSKHFLTSYLEYAQEDQSVWPLLAYYMLEKAMIRTYADILYDQQLDKGKQYFLLAQNYLKELF